MIGWKVTARTLLILSLVLLPGILSINSLYGSSNFTSLSITLLPSSINPTGTFYVSAILLGATTDAAGIVIYEVFVGGSCSGATSQFSLVTVASHIVPNSNTAPNPTAGFTMNSAGTFGVNAIYFSSDSKNLGSTSLCKQVTVTKGALTSITTIFTPSGQMVTDAATLHSLGPLNINTATGTVQYNLYSGSSCSGNILQSIAVAVTAGIVPPSPSPFFTINTPGIYSLRAFYSGDSVFQGSTSACETPVTVQATVSISTALSFTTINVGKSVTDVATLSGFASGAAGSITFTLYRNSLTCSIGGTVLSTFTTPVINGVEKSAYVTPIFNAGGPYSFLAVYSGDSIDPMATSACEPLTVMASPTITTTLTFGTITLAGSVTDKATLTSATAGGTVIYQLFPAGNVVPGYSSGCAGLPVDTSQVTVSSGLVPDSNLGTKGAPFSGVIDFPTPGTYFFDAVYSGDTFNHGATSSCETLTVTKASPTITTTLSGTTLSGTTIDFGYPITDSATLLGLSATAGGTVTYNLYTNGGCSGSVVSASDTETVSGGTVPPSLPFTLSAPGSFSIKAIYSGDSNNNGATSSCEPFTVIPPITMTVSYSVTGGGSGSAPWFNYFFDGVAQHVQLTTTGVPESVDSGTTWTLSQTSGGLASPLLGGSSGTEQWVTTSDSGTASASTKIFNYQHQYSLTMIISPSGGGTTTPTGSVSPGTSTWENAAAVVTITATNGGFTFSSWTGSGTGSYTGPNNPSSVTMNGAITETATFT